jgi:hypothetical protein
MPSRGLRDYLSALEKTGELRRIPMKLYPTGKQGKA